MEDLKKDWTHLHAEITDIRKLSEFYIITIKGIETPLTVKDKIFNNRLEPYFLKDIDKISRQEILNLKWNLYITKGYYIKISKTGDIQKFNMESEKYYVSYLEIDGPLGSFNSLFREKEQINF